MIQSAVAVAGNCSQPEVMVDPQEVARILAKHDGMRSGLVAVLQEVQARFGYLPEQALRMVAERMERPLVDVYGVATFYRAFSLKPRGEHFICACLGTACHVRGGARIVEELERQLGIKAGETTPDRRFTLETANCLGACALGPIVVIDGRYFSRVRTPQVKELIEAARRGLLQLGGGEEDTVFPLTVSCAGCNHTLMDDRHPLDGHPSIRVTAVFDHRPRRLCLSSIYGRYRVSAEREPQSEAVAELYCPHCHRSLTGSWECPVCGAPMASLLVQGGGTVHVCTRWGCRERRLDLAGANT
jgi:NADH-quinone oxidoreductase subunit E